MLQPRTLKNIADVQGELLALTLGCIHHLPHSKNDGQHRALVVAGASTINVLIGGSALKGVRLPVRLLRGLHVLLVVARYQEASCVTRWLDGVTARGRVGT